MSTKLSLEAEKEVDAEYLLVKAGVRYWEDATIDGSEDKDGTIFGRDGSYWVVTIELETGRVIDWPEGVIADIHYKVCDDGEYWLLDSDKNKVAKSGFYYVPDVLSVDDEGYGDYIIMRIGADGVIVDWRPNDIKVEYWVAV